MDINSIKKWITIVSEVSITDGGALLDNLIDGDAGNLAIILYHRYEKQSNNYKTPTRIAFTTSELSNIIDEISDLHEIIMDEFQPNYQAYQVIDQLYRYFINDEYDFD